MTSIECSRCGYEWDYTGRKKYATCPECKKSNNLPTDEWEAHLSEMATDFRLMIEDELGVKLIDEHKYDYLRNEEGGESQD